MRTIFPISLLLTLLLSVTAVHADKADGSALTIRPWTYERIETIEKLLAKDAYAKALQVLDRMLPQVSDIAYEKAITLRTYAQVHAMREDYKRAADFLKRALATKALPSDQQRLARYNLAQLYMGDKQYRAGAAELEKLRADGKGLKPDGLVLLGTAYVQLKRWRDAVKPVRQAIAATAKPNESWYQLLFGIHYQLKQYKSGTAVLRKLVRFWPQKKTYWLQLAGIEQLRGRYRQALAVQELAHQRGFLTEESELLGLISLYLHQDYPHRAARMLEDGLKDKRLSNTRKNWQLLADAWARAREFDKAIVALQRVSALAKDGKADIQLARLYMEKENWSKVSSHARKALVKGKIDKGAAWLFAGIAALESDRLKDARSAFSKAVGYESAGNSARQWLAFLDSMPDHES